MKKTLIISAALGMASVASAADPNPFWWQGTTDSKWETGTNWAISNNDNQWAPTKNDCAVYIGADSYKSEQPAGTLPPKDGHVTLGTSYTVDSINIGANSSLTVNNGATLTVNNGINQSGYSEPSGVGDLTLTGGSSVTVKAGSDLYYGVDTLSISGNSKMTISGSYNLGITDSINIEAGSSLTLAAAGANLGGLNGTTDVNLSGAVESGDAAMLSITAGTFWGGSNKVIALTGTLDLSALPNTIGSVTLVDISAGSWMGGLTVDYSGLTLSNAAYGPASLAWVGTEGGNGKLVLSYVPEPTTATLSLLALAGLAARRRRK